MEKPTENNVVQIFDTTLRDGEQSPGASMTAEQKVVIARQLEKLGVDVIEAGFAASSEGDFESVRRVCKEVTRPRVVSLARARAKTSPTPGRSFGLRRYALRLRCEDDYRPRERARSECAGEAHDRGYRRVEVQSVRSTGRLEWEVTLQGRDKSGRDVRIRCQYDARTRRARLNLSAQDALPSLYTIAPETEQFPVRYAGNCATF